MASPKLSQEAKYLVVKAIIAGRTNNEIRRVLHDAGHADDLADQAFSYYRALPAVTEAIARKDEEAVQSGYAQRSERILKLALSARRFEERLAVSPDDTRFVPGKAFDIVSLHREYRETLGDISKLVDSPKPQALTIEGQFDIIQTAAAATDAKFAAVARKRGSERVSARPDAGTEGGT